jgi:transmembrane sensor
LFSSLPLWLEADVRTGFGEVQDVQLSDGSVVHLNGNSALTLRLDERHRELVLLEGEAWFEVQPDAARPFRVKAGSGAVTALGTAFNIRLRGGRTEVSVTEHRVAVDLMEHPADGPPRTILEQNQQVRFDANTGFGAVERIDGAHATAWRRGLLVFQDRPLGEVIAELNRYRSGYLLLGAGLDQRRVNGVFRTDRSLAVADALEASLKLHSIRLGHYLVLLYP